MTELQIVNCKSANATTQNVRWNFMIVNKSVKKNELQVNENSAGLGIPSISW